LAVHPGWGLEAFTAARLAHMTRPPIDLQTINEHNHRWLLLQRHTAILREYLQTATAGDCHTAGSRTIAAAAQPELNRVILAYQQSCAQLQADGLLPWVNQVRWLRWRSRRDQYTYQTQEDP
jgi:hypothetical protein